MHYQNASIYLKKNCRRSEVEEAVFLRGPVKYNLGKVSDV